VTLLACLFQNLPPVIKKLGFAFLPRMEKLEDLRFLI
jgi:hypothetical protein